MKTAKKPLYKKIRLKEYNNLIRDYNRLYEVANMVGCGIRRCSFCDEFTTKNYVCNNCYQDTSYPVEESDTRGGLIRYNLLRLPDDINNYKFSKAQEQRIIKHMKDNRIPLEQSFEWFYETKIKEKQNGK